LKSLFEYLGKPLPSESALRSIISTVAQDELNKVKEKIFQKDIFLIIDESEISGKQIFNTLIGIITEPKKTYLLDCRICDASVNKQYVIQLVDDILRNFSINIENCFLLISDAASYMTAAVNTLKLLYSKLFHVTCVSHLFHNCAERIRSKFDSVDNLISRLKAATIKNKERKFYYFVILDFHLHQ